MFLRQMLLITLCPVLLFAGLNFLIIITYLVNNVGWFLLIPGNLLFIFIIWYKKNKEVGATGNDQPSYRKSLKNDFIHEIDDWF